MPPLGSQVMYSHADISVAAADLDRVWDENELDAAVLPEVRRSEHVFRSAVANVRRRQGNGHGRVEVRADQVENNPERCSYQITRVVWDLAERSIEHEKNMRIEFNKRTGLITSTKLDRFDPALSSLEEGVREHFAANGQMVPGPKVRNAIRAQLLNVGAQSLLPRASVYFVPEQWGEADTKPVLDGLGAVLSALYGKGGVFYVTPMSNCEATVAVLHRQVVLNISESASTLAQRCVERLQRGSDRAPRTDMIRNLRAERRRLLDSFTFFQQLIGVGYAEIGASLRELDAAIERLQALADAA